MNEQSPREELNRYRRLFQERKKRREKMYGRIERFLRKSSPKIDSILDDFDLRRLELRSTLLDKWRQIKWNWNNYEFFVERDVDYEDAHPEHLKYSWLFFSRTLGFYMLWVYYYEPCLRIIYNVFKFFKII